MPQLADTMATLDDDSSSGAATDPTRNWNFCGVRMLSKTQTAFIYSMKVGMKAAFICDFYITKYQGKMMEALTPLFQTMVSGIHRLEETEK